MEFTSSAQKRTARTQSNGIDSGHSALNIRSDRLRAGQQKYSIMACKKQRNILLRAVEILFNRGFIILSDLLLLDCVVKVCEMLCVAHKSFCEIQQKKLYDILADPIGLLGPLAAGQ